MNASEWITNVELIDPDYNVSSYFENIFSTVSSW